MNGVVETVAHETAAVRDAINETLTAARTQLVDPAKVEETKSRLRYSFTSGLGSSGNIGEKLAVFEPTHGSAPKYSGMYKVNPIATILTAKMMLDWLGEADAARRIEEAVAAIVREGEVRTYDMGGSASTLEMAEAISRKL